MADVRLAVSLGVRADVIPCTNSMELSGLVRGWKEQIRVKYGDVKETG